MSKTTKLDVAKEIVKEVGIPTPFSVLVSDGLTKATKQGLETLLKAILDMKKEHAAEIEALKA